MLDHHLVGQTGRDDDREQRSKGHAHLEDPPERSLRPCEGRIRKELVSLEYYLVYLLFHEVDAEIGYDVCHGLGIGVSG